MNYYAARQRESDGKFDYTCHNDGRTYPVGYCRAYRPFDDKDLGTIFCGDAARMAKENEKYGQYANKYHSDGHATADEAGSCYRRYLLDNRSRLHSKKNEDADVLNKCAICGKWCANLGEVDSWIHWYLCDEHLTQESLDELFPDVGSSFSS
jgi:hypothetical protein